MAKVYGRLNTERFGEIYQHKQYDVTGEDGGGQLSSPMLYYAFARRLTDGNNQDTAWLLRVFAKENTLPAGAFREIEILTEHEERLIRGIDKEWERTSKEDAQVLQNHYNQTIELLLEVPEDRLVKADNLKELLK